MYLLDTNTCVFLLNQRPQQVRQRFEQIPLEQLCTSSIVLYELDAGARKGRQAQTNIERIERFLSVVQVMPFDQTAAREAGRLRQHLRELGTPIGDFDTLIAGHALTLQATLVTNNVGEFSRVPGLVMEDWLS